MPTSLDSITTHSTGGLTGVKQTPFDASLWTGRSEPDESPRALYWYQVVRAHAPLNVENGLSQSHSQLNRHSQLNKHNQPDNLHQKPASNVTLVGFACDQGVRRNLGRIGAKLAPSTIRQAFAKLPLTPAIQAKFTHTEYATLLADAGDVTCNDNDSVMPNVLEDTQAAYSQQVAKIIQQGSLAIGLGGGHAIAYGSYMGLWQALNPQLNADNPKLNTESSVTPTIGIINFDAHLDIRHAPKGTSGTPFRQIAEHNKAQNQPFHYCAIGISRLSNSAALFDRADALGVTIISDDSCARDSWNTLSEQLQQFIEKVDVLYITIDMDAFPASVVPGVSAPAAKGISLDFAERCLEVIFHSGKVKIVDIAEINPSYDIDERSGKVAARLLALMIEHHLLLDPLLLDR